MHDVRKCPNCGGKTKVIDSSRNVGYMNRRRECDLCGFRFSTHEISNDELKRLCDENTKLEETVIEVGGNTTSKWLRREVNKIDIELKKKLQVGHREHLERKKVIYIMCIESIEDKWYAKGTHGNR